MNKDFPCKCGHQKEQHGDNGVVTYTGIWIYQACYFLGVGRTTIEDCPCISYQPSNLAYLKERYEKISKTL